MKKNPNEHTEQTWKILLKELLSATETMQQALVKVSSSEIFEAARRQADALDQLELAIAQLPAPEKKQALWESAAQIMAKNKTNDLVARAGKQGLMRWMRRVSPNTKVDSYGADGTAQYQPGA